MKKLILSAFIVLMSVMVVFGQAKREREVKNLFAQIEKTNDDFKKTELANRIQNEMIEILIEADDFYYDFPSLKNVGKILSPDEQIHMYTWNVILSDGAIQYYALFQHNEFNSIYLLSQGSPQVPETTGYVAEKDWYGALYYDIYPIKFKDKEVYLVFGLVPATEDSEVQYKVVDVMSFSKKAIKMGAPSFITPWTGKKKQHRVVFEYDKKSQMSVDYNKKKKTITFDHLEPIRQVNGKDILAPDGSYDALIYKKDLWTYKADVSVKNKKEKKSKK